MSLHVITGAFNIGGGIAAVNRLLIYSMSEKVERIQVLALSEKEDAGFRGVTNDQCKLDYSIYNDNKIRFCLAILNKGLRKSIDWVICDHINIAASLGILNKLMGIKYIVWVHGEEVFPPKPTIEGHLGLKNASKVLTSSAFTAQVVQNIYPHLSVLPCDLALDPIKYPRLIPIDELLRLSSEVISIPSITGTRERLGERVILNVARMSSFQRYKGQDTLLNAFPTVQSGYPDAQLVLCGDGDDYARIFKLASSLPLEVQRNIFMPGYVGDDLLNRLFRRCYLFTMPSSGEGFGLVYLEAMSFARPCLGGKLDATPCVVRDGITGILMDDPTSAKQVADKLLWLLSNPQSARAMGVEGYELVRTNYLFEHFRQRFWDVLAT